ncbi:MAG: NADH-quinone oxidoreductase subunit A [candidate division Zixibacteria bacterium SM23_73_2]|nr:MAG: NADH-quinone oxidoreductase subunit A [candidate division Zixibacteria bacterium SM23_73_2]
MPQDYAFTGLFLIVGVVFVVFVFFLAKLARPKNPNPEKLRNYECGEVPFGSAWVQYNVRYYIYALIFVIFDVEVVFLFPWAVVYKSLGFFAFVEMMIFLAVLIFGLVYVWTKGALKWVR